MDNEKDIQNEWRLMPGREMFFHHCVQDISWSAHLSTLWVLWNLSWVRGRGGWTVSIKHTATSQLSVPAFIHCIWTAVPAFIHCIWTAVPAFIHCIWTAVPAFIHCIWTAVPAFIHCIWTAVPNSVPTEILFHSLYTKTVQLNLSTCDSQTHCN
jgi:hypothetical protein